MNRRYDMCIIGGGLAGLTAGLHLAQRGYAIVLFERQPYPHHKVCGEYVSMEVLPYLQSLGIELSLDELPQLERLQLTTENGKELHQRLPLGGFGISRYKLDELLYRKAVERGVEVFFTKVNRVHFNGSAVEISTADKQTYSATLALGAWGKRSSLDKAASRPFIQKKSPWMGVKAHYQSDFADDLIALHNFRGGYCGMSKVEDNILNACYLVDTRVFQQYGSIEALEAEVLMKNPYWAAWKTAAKPLFEKPLVISQISFEQKAPVVNHVLMIGDSAGLIHPLCGNGMAMAIHGAKIAAEGCIAYFQQGKNREKLETNYQKQWTKAFQSRLNAGRFIQHLLLQQKLAPHLISTAQLFPGLIPSIIRKTHGKPLAEISA